MSTNDTLLAQIATCWDNPASLAYHEMSFLEGLRKSLEGGAKISPRDLLELERLHDKCKPREPML